MKEYIIVAGANGVGKSTIFQTDEALQKMSRINVDEILREIGRWDNPDDLFRAGKIAVKRLNDCLEKEVSFNQETTLCGKTIVNTVHKAKDKQYYVKLLYVGVDDVEILQKRVAQRVKNGGHGISEQDLIRRYKESFQKLKEILPLCNEAIIYDNTDVFFEVARFRDGKCVEQARKLPHWFEELNI